MRWLSGAWMFLAVAAAACGGDEAAESGGHAGVGGSAAGGGASGAGGTSVTGGSAGLPDGGAGSSASGGAAGAATTGGAGGGSGGSAGQGAACEVPPGGLALGFAGPFVPTEALPIQELLLPAPSGLVFARMELTLDVTHGGWYAPKPDGAHGVFQITVGKKWAGSLYGFMPWRGPPSKLVRVNSNIGLPQHDMSHLQTTKLLEEQKKYHVRYVYDGPSLTRSLEITSDGQVVVDISKPDAVATVTSVAPGYPILLATELACEGCGPEVPMYGWKLENLCVQLFP